MELGTRSEVPSKMVEKLHELYGLFSRFSPELAKEAILMGKKYPDMGARNVSWMMLFCAEKAIKFEVRTRIRDQSVTNDSPQQLEYFVTVTRPFIEGADIEGDSRTWRDCLQTAFLGALYGALC